MFGKARLGKDTHLLVSQIRKRQDNRLLLRLVAFCAESF